MQTVFAAIHEAQTSINNTALMILNKLARKLFRYIWQFNCFNKWYIKFVLRETFWILTNPLTHKIKFQTAAQPSHATKAHM